MSEELDFENLAPVEIPVPIGPSRYLLREASEGAVVQWRDSQVAKAKFGEEGGLQGIGAIAESEPLLVSLCLYELAAAADRTTRPVYRHDEVFGYFRCKINGDPEPRHLVPLTTVRGWPARIIKPLFEKLKEISGLDEKDSPQLLRKQLKRLVKLLRDAPPPEKGAYEIVLQEALDAVRAVECNGVADPTRADPVSTSSTGHSPPAADDSSTS